MQIPTSTNTASLRYFNFSPNTHCADRPQEDPRSIIKETDLLFPNQKTRPIVRLLRSIAVGIDTLITQKNADPDYLFQVYQTCLDMLKQATTRLRQTHTFLADARTMYKAYNVLKDALQHFYNNLENRHAIFPQTEVYNEKWNPENFIKSNNFTASGPIIDINNLLVKNERNREIVRTLQSLDSKLKNLESKLNNRRLKQAGEFFSDWKSIINEWKKYSITLVGLSSFI